MGRPTLTMATMATATAIPTMAMATGEGRRGQQMLTPFLIPSQLLIQTLRLMPTMVTMATGAGVLLTMGTLGRPTTDTTGAKHKMLSQEVEFDLNRSDRPYEQIAPILPVHSILNILRYQSINHSDEKDLYKQKLWL